MNDFDTIAAISTGIGEAGISIIRISGKDSLNIVSDIFRGNSYYGLKDFKTYTLKHGYIFDSVTKKDIDEVILSYMKAPKSYTAEDIIEINCHGGVTPTKAILELVLRNGARLAEPGEFTKRAFLNGRIDLSQAEAVIDIIRSKTKASLKAALLQAEGHLSLKIREIRENILNIIAHIEATVDYPEEDLEEITAKNVETDLAVVISYIEELLKNADEGKLLREGISTVIVGKPNVGKSSLLNNLLRENRAIVSNIPGTTRDIIEEYINIEGIPIKIIDTAGIRNTEDELEKIGVNLSKGKLEEADLIIFVIDLSERITSEDIDILKTIVDKKFIVLLCKSDIEAEIDLSLLSDINKDNIIKVSNFTGEGIDKLKKRVKEIFFQGEIEHQDIVISSTRHKDVLIKALNNCYASLIAVKNTGAIDLASIDLKNAWSNLGEITGDTLEENIVDRIFSKFCIGK